MVASFVAAGSASAAIPPEGSQAWRELHQYAPAITAMKMPDIPTQDCCGIARDCRRTMLRSERGGWVFLASKAEWEWGDDRWHPVPPEKIKDYDNGVPFAVVCAGPGAINNAGDPFVFCAHSPTGG